MVESVVIILTIWMVEIVVIIFNNMNGWKCSNNYWQYEWLKVGVIINNNMNGWNCSNNF